MSVIHPSAKIARRIFWAQLTACFLPGCTSLGVGNSKKTRAWEASMGAVPNSKISPQQLSRSVNLRRSYIPRGRYGRRKHRPMKPAYITIHSTQNYTGDAWAHAKALRRGALRGGTIGYLCWHFTVQEDVVVQHIPTSERGEHADFDGPGNRKSIAIEMCEHRGNSQARTLDRTAKLTASLMYHHKISLSHVVPHYHWPRAGYSPAHKNCPHYLLENGRPGPTWAWFKGRIGEHYKRISA
jgi:N-acetylmuramoyl-L-alanine amidase